MTDVSELIPLIEGAAPTLAKVLIPGPAGIAVSLLAPAALSHLAEHFGLPKPADASTLTSAIQGAPPKVADTILKAAEAEFVAQTSQVAPSVQASPAPVQAAPAPAPAIVTHTGVTMDPIAMVIFLLLSAMSGWMVQRGINFLGFWQALTGSADLQAGAVMMAGVITTVYRLVKGSNKNTMAALGQS